MTRRNSDQCIRSTYTKRNHHCKAFTRCSISRNCRELRNMDITIVVKYYQIWTCGITGSLEQNWSFYCKKLTSPRGRSKFYKGSNIGIDDEDELKKPELVTSCCWITWNWHTKNVTNKIKTEEIEVFEFDVDSLNITRIEFSFTWVFA